MADRSNSKRAVYAALIGNILVAVSKFVAAVTTGSAAMLSEAVHSVVDTTNEMLLLYGEHRAQLPPDKEHPLGYGRELYFWSFVVALVFFALGAGVSVYQGINRVLHPHPLEDVGITYAVLALSAVFEGGSLMTARRAFKKRKGHLGYIDAIRKSKDPALFTVLLEDSAALLGLSIAAAGILGASYFNMPELDGAASICIGVMLAVVAIFLAGESKDLLIGEQASDHLESEIMDIAARDSTVNHANGVITIHLAPEEIVAALSAEFVDSAATSDIEAAIARIETAVKEKEPAVAILFVKPQTVAQWKAARQRHRSR